MLQVAVTLNHNFFNMSVSYRPIVRNNPRLIVSGRGSYGTESTDDSEESSRHLYQCCVTNGVFLGEEILGFSQSSLQPESAWILDAGNVVWVWLGNVAPTRSLRECVESATIFLYTHPAGRDRNTTISVIKQGLEPPTFIGLFDNWNHNHLRDYRSFETMRDSLQDKESSVDKVVPAKVTTSNFDAYTKYPLRVLKNDPEQLPAGVDVSRKEMHLTYDDFIAAFKMNPTEFEKLPAWRRQRLKQTAGLF